MNLEGAARASLNIVPHEVAAGRSEHPGATRPHPDAFSWEPESLPTDPDPPIFVEAGRQHHLARIDAAIEALSLGEPGVLFLAAEPGTGKTALIAHACREAIQGHPALAVLWGDCATHTGAADPHHPFRQALGVMAGDAESASRRHLGTTSNADRLAQRISAALLAILTDAQGLVDRFIPRTMLQQQRDNPHLDGVTISALNEFLESPDSGPSAHGINEQVFRMFARYAAAGPVILVVEDLHWADVGTATLLFHLIRRLLEQPVPLLVLGSYRPSELGLTNSGARSPFVTVLRETSRLLPDPVIDLSDVVGGDPGRSCTPPACKAQWSRRKSWAISGARRSPSSSICWIPSCTGAFI